MNRRVPWALLCLAAGCAPVVAGSPPSPPPTAVASEDASWRAGLEAFHASRERIIGGDDGWVTLIGRFPLTPGANTVGSAPGANVVLPSDRSPARAGTLFVEASVLRFEAAPGAGVTSGGRTVETITLVGDGGSASATILELGSLRFHVIVRGGRHFLRVKDRQSPGRVAFQGLSWFPADPAWRLRGRFEPSPPGTTVPVFNIINQTEEQLSPGHVLIQVGGVEHRLLALKDGDEPGLFIVFRDQSAGAQSYGGGRFLDTGPPAADGSVEVDFNRAYSPPCAFTRFATCPLPPRENQLPLHILAGERYLGGH